MTCFLIEAINDRLALSINVFNIAVNVKNPA